MGAAATLTLTAGTWNTGGFALHMGHFVSTGAAARTAILGSSVISLTGTGATAVWNVTSSLTLSAASSTLAITSTDGGQKTFTGGGLTYGTLQFIMTSTNSLSLVIGGSNTFAVINLQCTGTGTPGVFGPDSGTQTITTTLTLVGNATHSMVVDSVSGTPSQTIFTCNSAVTVTRTNMSKAGTHVKFNFKLACLAGSYAITGNSTTLPLGIKISATAGSVAITGAAASLPRGLKFTAAPGAIALTGTATSLPRGLKMTATAASMAITGASTSLPCAIGLSAAPGSVAITGTSTSLPRGIHLAALAGTVTITGSAANLPRSLVLVSSPGSVVISGADAGLRSAYVMAGLPGDITIVGADATFTINGTPIIYPAATGGSFTLGSDGTLTTPHAGAPTDSRDGRLTQAHDGRLTKASHA
jgi:hypothetical protein